MFKYFFFILLGVTIANSVLATDNFCFINSCDTLKYTSEQYSKLENLLSASFQNYNIMDTVFGDLNLDKEIDCIVIMEEKRLTPEMDAKLNRKTVFVIGSGGDFSVISSNDYIVDCNICGGSGVGDSYYRPVIEKGLINFKSVYGDCDKTAFYVCFIYNSAIANWELNQIYKEAYSCNFDGDEPEIKTETKTRKDFGLVLFESYK